MITVRAQGSNVVVGGKTAGIALIGAGKGASKADGFRVKDDVVLSEGPIQHRINEKNEHAPRRKVVPDD